MALRSKRTDERRDVLKAERLP